VEVLLHVYPAPIAVPPTVHFMETGASASAFTSSETETLPCRVPKKLPRLLGRRSSPRDYSWWSHPRATRWSRATWWQNLALLQGEAADTGQRLNG